MENALAIRSIQDVQKTAEIMVASGFFKDATDVAKACVKIMAGQELGISPMAAMRGIHIVEGQPQIGAHLMGAMIKRSGKYDYCIKQQTNEICSIEFWRAGHDAPEGESTFTMDDAKRAGLAGRGQWNKYPAAMLYSRALSQGARMYCPDIFLGSIYYEGEIEEAKAAEPDITPKDAAPPESPKRPSGLVQAWDADTQQWVHGPAKQAVGDATPHNDEWGDTVVDDFAADHEDDIPDPMTEPQRLKLLGMLKQLGVRDGDKRELLDLLNLDKYSASGLIDKIVKEGADVFPWQVLSVYIGMLRDRTGKTNEDVKDFCESTYDEKHPAKLDRQGRTALFEWLAGFTPEEGEEEMDDMAAWIEGAHVSSESLSKMNDEEIKRAISNWKLREERIHAS